MYDYIIVGSGLYGSVFAYEMNKLGKRCLIIERRNHIGGNCYTENRSGIEVHIYGPHIFNTNSKKIWDYINSIYPFIPYYHNVKVNYCGRLYTFPVNLNTMNELWGITSPQEAIKKLDSVRISNLEINNLESLILSELGEEIYNKFYKGYSEKQWGMSCDKIPSKIGARIPIRNNYNNNYHNSVYSGIPLNGSYTNIFNRLLEGIEVKLGEEFNSSNWRSLGKKLVYSGSIDEYYGYRYGKLGYRSLEFDHKELAIDNYQGISQVNYGEKEVPYTRIIEHKWFNYVNNEKTIITYEYPKAHEIGMERYYPIVNEYNNELYSRYRDIDNDIIFGGRLGSYKYLDMDKVIGMSLRDVDHELSAI